MMWLQTASWELLLLWLCWTVEAVSAMTPVVAAGIAGAAQHLLEQQIQASQPSSP
jgi:hypothetical protein